MKVDNTELVFEPVTKLPTNTIISIVIKDIPSIYYAKSINQLENIIYIHSKKVDKCDDFFLLYALGHNLEVFDFYTDEKYILELNSKTLRKCI